MRPTVGPWRSPLYFCTKAWALYVCGDIKCCSIFLAQFDIINYCFINIKQFKSNVRKLCKTHLITVIILPPSPNKLRQFKQTILLFTHINTGDIHCNIINMAFQYYHNLHFELWPGTSIAMPNRLTLNQWHKLRGQRNRLTQEWGCYPTWHKQKNTHINLQTTWPEQSTTMYIYWPCRRFSKKWTIG